MKAGEMTERHQVLGSQSDYYVLLDEQSDRIFDARLAQHIREASDGDRNGLIAGELPEIWMDHKGRRVWYVFYAGHERRAISRNADLGHLHTTDSMNAHEGQLSRYA